MSVPAMRVRLKHLYRSRDRHGNDRVYFRRGARKIRIREPIGSAEFLANHLLGSGSEVHIAFAAYKTLTAQGIKARVVSLPCWQLFEEQDQAYRDSVLPPNVTARVSIEAG